MHFQRIIPVFYADQFRTLHADMLPADDTLQLLRLWWKPEHESWDDT